jgi:hypothetical protein
MLDDDLLYPPIQYSAGWLLLLLAALLLAIAAAVVIAMLTRPKRVRVAPTPHPQYVLQQLRGEYLARIDDVERRVRAGELDARKAHVELSRLLRGFVAEYSGIEAPVMTLPDLVDRGVHPALVDAISRFTNPSIFRRRPPVDPVLGAEAARTAVNAWH